MREVQVVCPQCGGSDAYLEPEKGDYTGVPCGTVFHQPWRCRHCGYPEVIWTQYGAIYRPQQPIVGKITITINGVPVDPVCLSKDIYAVKVA